MMDQVRRSDTASREESWWEEAANTFTHGLGAILAIAGLVALVGVVAHESAPRHVASAWIYGGALVVLYIASTLYHAIWNSNLKRRFKKFDQCAIFLLIAGSYTPFALLVIPAPWDVGFFIIIWSLALIGIVFRLTPRFPFRRVYLPFYLLLGWSGVVWVDVYIATLPPEGMFWLVVGGLSYSLGVVFFSLRRLPFNHAIWHLFVMGGSASHFVCVMLYVLPFAMLAGTGAP